jgi:hypothetical protein
MVSPEVKVITASLSLTESVNDFVHQDAGSRRWRIPTRARVPQQAMTLAGP